MSVVVAVALAWLALDRANRPVPDMLPASLREPPKIDPTQLAQRLNEARGEAERFLSQLNPSHAGVPNNITAQLRLHWDEKRAGRAAPWYEVQ